MNLKSFYFEPKLKIIASPTLDNEKGLNNLGVNNGKFEHFLACCMVASY